MRATVFDEDLLLLMDANSICLLCWMSSNKGSTAVDERGTSTSEKGDQALTMARPIWRKENNI